MHLTFRATGIRPYPETASWQAKNAGANDGGDFLESLDVMAERVGFVYCGICYLSPSQAHRHELTLLQ
jgi:hypothetical protein